jgi:hypothetical protein
MFVHIVPPPVRLLIAGSGIDTLPVISCAQMLGWQTTLLVHSPEIFDREQFSRADEVVIAYPKEPEITADAQTAVMIMTHNYGRDLAWLRTLLPMPLRYVGLLGPKRRREKLLADLAEHGLELSHISLAHLYNPAGLDLGAESPEEIALSITAEINMVLSCCGGGSLRSRKGPIHDLRVEAGRQERNRRGLAMRAGAIILAAGGSRRLGQPKQLLAHGEASLLRHTACAAIESRCRPIMVVLGANDDECARELADLPVQTSVNASWKLGLGSSIRVGLDAIPASPLDVVVLLVCDQPFLSGQVIDELVNSLTDEKSIAACGNCPPA